MHSASGDPTVRCLWGKSPGNRRGRKMGGGDRKRSILNGTLGSRTACQRPKGSHSKSARGRENEARRETARAATLCSCFVHPAISSAMRQRNRADGYSSSLKRDSTTHSIPFSILEWMPSISLTCALEGRNSQTRSVFGSNPTALDVQYKRTKYSRGGVFLRLSTRIHSSDGRLYVISRFNIVTKSARSCPSGNSAHAPGTPNP